MPSSDRSASEMGGEWSAVGRRDKVVSPNAFDSPSVHAARQALDGWTVADVLSVSRRFKQSRLKGGTVGWIEFLSAFDSHATVRLCGCVVCWKW